MNGTSFLRRLGALLVVLNLLSTNVALADSKPEPLPNPDLQLLLNGVVRAIERQPDGGIIFGGRFSSVNGSVRYNIARLLPDGTLDPDWIPEVRGEVLALAVDNHGDVYVGGDFHSVGVYGRLRLAKLAGNGRGAVDGSWDPSANGLVRALALNNSGDVFISGDFTNIGGQERNRLAKLATAGVGVADPFWTPSADHIVYTLAVDSSGAVYAGGHFSNIGGQQRDRIAKLDGSGSGLADSNWDARSYGSVFALAIGSNDEVYAGGSFARIGGQQRRNIAKLVGGGTGEADLTWAPFTDDLVSVLVVGTDSTVYAAGLFTEIDGEQREGIAKIDSDGTVSADWHPSPNERVWALALSSNGLIHAGGEFISVSGESRLGFATLGTTGAPTIAINDAERPGMALAVAGQPDGGMIVGGSFLKVDDQPRAHLLRLSPDGTLDQDWRPVVEETWGGAEVHALAVNSTGAVYAGGRFTVVGGQIRVGIAKIAGSGTGVVDPDWYPGRIVWPHALAVDANDDVYVGGNFTSVNDEWHEHIAKLDGGGTGAMDVTWKPAANGPVRALAIDSSGNLLAGGDFTRIGGETRSHIAKLSANGLADPNWDPSANNTVHALAIDGSDAVYMGGYFTVVGGVPRSHIAKINSGGIVDPDWDPSANNLVKALALDDNGDVYAAGRFAQIGGEPRIALAKLAGMGDGSADPVWYPRPFGTMTALAMSSNGVLYAGGSFSQISGVPRQGIVALPTSVFWTLVYRADANGSIIGAATQRVQHGRDGTPVTALPDPGYEFVYWFETSANFSRENPRTDANVTGDVWVTARFDPIPLQVVAVPTTGNGRIEPTWQGVHKGSTATLWTTPDDGFHVDTITGDHCTVSSVDVNTWVTGPIEANCAVHVTFAANPPPVAASLTITMPVDTPQSIALSASDNNQGGPFTFVFALAEPPQHGNAVINGDTATYTPDAGYAGTDSFTYTAATVNGTSFPASVNITIEAAATIEPPEPIPALSRFALLLLAGLLMMIAVQSGFQRHKGN